MVFSQLPRSPWRAQPSGPDDRQTALESVQDARFAIQETGNWIKNADTKSTVVAAATGVVATALASKAGAVHEAFANGGLACIGPMLVLLIVSYIATLIGTTTCLYRALSPRTRPTSMSNRFAWPSAELNGPEVPNSSWTVVQREAWGQNYMLACIAGAKYRAFRSALQWFGASLAITIAIVCIVAWATAGTA